MAWDFRPGMRVVCISRPQVDPFFQANLPEVGKVYTLRAVEFDDLDELLLCRLEEVLNTHVVGKIASRGGVNFMLAGEPGFDTRHFRPLDERRIDCLRVHLAPKRVEEHA